jgi:hypothetical protein
VALYIKGAASTGYIEKAAIILLYPTFDWQILLVVGGGK